MTYPPEVVIFGANSIAIRLIDESLKRFSVRFVIDNDRDKQGHLLAGIPILSPEVIKEHDNGRMLVIIASDNHVDEMLSELKAFGLTSDQITDYEHFESIARKNVFLNTLPKSGSVWISNILQEYLHSDMCRLSGGDWFARNHNLLNREWLARLVGQGGLAQEHLPINDLNLKILNHYSPDIILHVRDPRQALISYVHHVSGHIVDNELESQLLGMGPEFKCMEFPLQVDHCIAPFFDHAIEWLDGWMTAIKSESLKARVLMTRHEDLAAAPETFWQKIGQFLQIDVQRAIQQKPQSGRRHFRSGKTEEWREVLSPEQIELLNQNMSDDLLSFYGWQR